ncbi:hypothetical protein ACTFIZ_006495 [Dictyostelium cf. discoideum]
MSVASRIRDKLKNNLESSGGHSVVTSGTKVIRYRAGQRPDYAEAEDDHDSHFSNIQNQKSIKEAETNDPRLARFKNRSSNQDEPQSVEERKASRRRHHDNDNDNDTATTTSRRIQKTEIIKEDDNTNDTKKDDNKEEEEDDDDDDDRRRRAKERYLKKKEEEQKQKELEEKQQPFKDIEGESEEEGSGSSEYETDSEEDDDDDDNEYWNQQPIFRPTFIKKDDRGTIKTDEQWEKEEQEQQAQLEREKEQRKIEAHRKLKDELDRDRKEQEAKELEQKEEEEYDDEDQDGSKKLLWIQRELERVRLEIHTRLLAEFEKKEFERRRAMTDDQILKEDPSRSRANIDNSQKKQLKFLQRDYHRGAFFQDDEYIKNKDFSAPTGEDKFNRELLPKVMQVKNFGKAGRTKYTHLKDQDTTEKDSLWNTNYNNNNKKYNNNNSNSSNNNNNRDYNYRDRDNSNNEMKNIKLEDIKKSINENVGGLGNTVSFIVDRINDLFNLDGLDIIGNIINDGNDDQSYPCNILINGRSGIGKSLLIKSILTRLSINYKIINSSNLFQKDDGDTEKLIESIFNTASSQSPFVLVFEEIDSISQIRNDSLGYIEQRVVSNFLTLLESNSKKRSVFVIGVTSRIESIDTAFFSIGKFDSVLNLPIPSPNDRKEILYLLFKKFPNFNNNEIHYKELSEYLGECTHGFVGSDLNSLCKEAILVNIKRSNDCSDGYNLIEKFDFNKAFEIVKPSILNQYKLPTIGYGSNGFNEIGGLDEIIEKIKSSILTPMLNKSVLDRLGIKSPSGILLYGPPGNGKSLIARAIASSSPNINFISISSTDIIDPVVGASEKNLSKLFKTLRESSPCILFLDQVEVLAKLRGFDDSSEQSSDRLLSCLLTEIDGIYGGGGGGVNNNNQSIVLAATTRIDLLDPSILRPGRFDYHIEIPNPNKEARLDIFKKITKSMPLDENIDFIKLSELTQGFNGADINNLCKETALLALRNDININNISMSNFLDALKFTKSSSTK